MYENDILPAMINLGIPYAECGNMNPRMVKPFKIANDNKIKHDDLMSWIQGKYFFDALSRALSNVFSKKGKKPLEYIKEPYLKDFGKEERSLTQAEIEKHTNNLFNMLEDMQKSFESTHKNS